MKPMPVLAARANFLSLPTSSTSYRDARIVVLPAPYEHSVSCAAGTAGGPRALLKASACVEFYDDELDRELCKEVGIVTVPPVRFGKKVNRAAVAVLRKEMDTHLAAGKFVVTLGGEHTISLATIPAHLQRYPTLSVLQFDAHSDLRDSYRDNKFSHASVMARVCEQLDPRSLVQVGIRAQAIEEVRFIRERGVLTLTAHQIRGGGRPGWEDEVLERLSDCVYVSFDVDGFDPSIMPATGTPEPNGLLWAETMRLLRKVGERKAIVGADVVELSPMKGLPHPNLTAAWLTYKLMNYAFLR